jgi:hypothetical protein
MPFVLCDANRKMIMPKTKVWTMTAAAMRPCGLSYAIVRAGFGGEDGELE